MELIPRETVVKPIQDGEWPEWEEGGPHRFVTLEYKGRCDGCGEQVLYYEIKVGLN